MNNDEAVAMRQHEMDLRARALEAALATPSPARAAVRSRAVLLAALATASALPLFLVLGGVRVGPRPLSLIVATTLGTLALAAGALVLSVRRGGSMLGRSRPALLAVAFALPPALLLWKAG